MSAPVGQASRPAEPIKKIRLATVWLDGCSGCHMSLLDTDERLIELAKRVTVVWGPLVDRKEFPAEVDVTLVEGAISSEEDLHRIKMVRARTKLLVSLGDCAVTGNVTAMRNIFKLEDVLDRAYRQTATVVVGIPLGNGVVPRLLERVRPVHEVVKVDHFIPGCPPSADVIHEFVVSLLEGRTPVLDGRFG